MPPRSAGSRTLSQTSSFSFSPFSHFQSMSAALRLRTRHARRSHRHQEPGKQGDRGPWKHQLGAGLVSGQVDDGSRFALRPAAAGRGTACCPVAEEPIQLDLHLARTTLCGLRDFGVPPSYLARAGYPHRAIPSTGIPSSLQASLALRLLRRRLLERRLLGRRAVRRGFLRPRIIRLHRRQVAHGHGA